MDRSELAAALGAEPADVEPLSGGAGRCQMWTLTASGRPLVFRQFPEGFERDVVRGREWGVLELANQAGVPVPCPVALTPTGIVVERAPGEARPRRLLADERWAVARSTLVARVAQAAARLHAIGPPDFLPHGLELDGDGGVDGAPAGGADAAEAAIATLERCLDRIDEPHPAIELGLRWLRRNLPEPGPASIVHGDFRLSNLVVSEDGHPVLIDWELAHVGNGAEDLGWMCVRSWRFGGPGEALGCGSREALLSSYAAAGGRRITPEELRWWEVCGNARWAVICMLQAERHRSGVDRSLERAMIGRRTCEAEWDLLELLSDGRPAPAASEAPQDDPGARELLIAVAEFLHDLRSRTPPEDSFTVAVAANACRVVSRELDANYSPNQPAARGQAAQLAGALRAGARDAELELLIDPLRAQVRAKLRIAHPGWDEMITPAPQ
jgi:aminoglycoside phosphotransferase (APT) family kinase protein